MKENQNTPIIYDAFISYRHSELDKMVAEQLHKILETFKVPRSISKNLSKKKISRVFRDRDELPSSSNLADNITEALQHSEYLIVICSPRTPESQWVSKEIETFSKMHGHDKILALLIEGEPYESFPPSLRFVKKVSESSDGALTEEMVEVEPLAADIRSSSKRGMKKLLKKEFLRLAAALLSCKYDDLKQRHRERKMRKIITASCLFTLFFALFGSFSLYQGIQIKEQMQKVLRTQSRYLADVSARLLDEGDRRSAILVAKEALPKNLKKPERPYVEEAEFALSNALYTYKYDTRFVSDLALSHPDKINFLKLSPDGALVVTSCHDGYLYIWETNGGKCLGKVRTSSPYLDGERLYFLNDTDFVFLDSNALTCVEAKRAAIKWSRKNMSSSKMAVSEDKKRIAVVHDESIVMMDEQGEALLTFPFVTDSDSYVCEMKFSPDGSKLLMTQEGGKASLVDAKNGNTLRTFKTTYASLLYATFVGDSKIALGSNYINLDNLLGGSKGVLEVFDIKEGSLLGSTLFEEDGISDLTYLENTNEIMLIAGMKVDTVSLDNYHISGSFIHGDLVTKYCLREDIAVTGSQDGTIRFCLTENKMEYEPLRISHLGRISSLELGKGLIGATYFDSSKGYIFRMLEGNEITRLGGHGDTIKYGEFSSDDQKVLTTTHSLGELLVWDAKNKKLLNKIDLGEEIVQAHFIENSDLITAVTKDNVLWTLEALSNKPLRQMQLEEPYGFFYSKDSSLLAFNVDSNIKVINTNTLKALATISTDSFYSDLVFSSDNEKLLASSMDSAVVYDVKTGAPIYTLKDENLKMAYLCPDGKGLIAIYEDLTFQIVKLSSSQKPVVIKDNAINIEKIDFSPDNKLIFVGLENGTVNIYNLDNGSLIKTLEGLEDVFYACTYSKDKKYFITFSGYQSAIIWDAESYKKLGKIDYLLDVKHDFTDLLASYNQEVILMPYYTLDKLLEEANRQLGGRTLSEAEKEKLFIER